VRGNSTLQRLDATFALFDFPNWQRLPAAAAEALKGRTRSTLTDFAKATLRAQSAQQRKDRGVRERTRIF